MFYKLSKSVHTLLSILLLTSSVLYAQYSQNVSFSALSAEERAKLNFEVVTQFQNDSTLLVRLMVLDSASRFVSGMATDPKGNDAIFSILKPKSGCGLAVKEVVENAGFEPLNISIVLDYSGSMDRFYPRLQSDAQHFIESLMPNLFTRVNFDDHVVVVNPIPTDSPTSVKKDNYFEYGGLTALYRGIFNGIETLSATSGNRVLVVFSDGLENASMISAKDVLEKARKNHVTIYAIGFDLAGKPPLEELCKKTGGEYYPVADINHLSEAFNHFGGKFSHHYALEISCKENVTLPMTIGVKGLDEKHSLVIDSESSWGTLPSEFEEVKFFSFLFEFNSSTQLIPAQNGRIKDVAKAVGEYLLADEKREITFVGHSSPEGDSIYNMKLSRERVDFIFKRIFKEIERQYRKSPEYYRAIYSRNRIKIRFEGEKYPISDVKSYKNFENRRVDMIGFPSH